MSSRIAKHWRAFKAELAEQPSAITPKMAKALAALEKELDKSHNAEDQT
jgi:hypothetical protein